MTMDGADEFIGTVPWRAVKMVEVAIPARRQIRTST